MGQRKKLTVGVTPGGPVIIRAWVRHWITGKPIYPVRAKAIAFVPRRRKSSK